MQYPGGMQMMPSGWQVPTSPRANLDKLSSLVGQRLRGKVRSWKEHWGFLVSPKFEGDIFVHRQNLRFEGEPMVGKPVSFTVTVDDRNRVTATEVTEPTAGAEDFEGAMTLTGRIRSWKNEWGFIVAPEHFEGDLFCHKEHVNLDVPEGEMARVVVERAVSFEVMTDSKGRTHAAKVNLLEPVDMSVLSQPWMGMAVPPKGAGKGKRPAAEPEQLMDNGEVLTGTLRSWREPWGFIVCPEKFEGDLFVHKETFSGEVPDSASAGRTVNFLRAIDGRGRPHAIQVQLLGGYAPQNAIANAPNNQAWQGTSGPITATNKYEHCVGMPLHGSCRSWKSDWGFVVSEVFEGDLFAHKMHLQNGAEFLTPGALLSFEVGGDSRGRATALNIKCINDAKDWVGSGVKLTGTVRSYREPWGFLVSPGSYTSDLFFHVEHVDPRTRALLCSGLEVTFGVQIDKKERCTAMEIQATGGMATPGKRKATSAPATIQPVKVPRFY
uniref:CSD domain-containing protein n=1 Tax=Alexandrium catenella TaxID=2925 RepID=A0A7S1WNC9_ALECA